MQQYIHGGKKEHDHHHQYLRIKQHRLVRLFVPGQRGGRRDRLCAAGCCSGVPASEMGATVGVLVVRGRFMTKRPLLSYYYLILIC